MSFFLFRSAHDLHQLKKSVAPPSESSGFGYELYHVSNLLYKTVLRPAGPLRLAGRFLLFSEDKPASKKKILRNFQKGGF